MNEHKADYSKDRFALIVGASQAGKSTLVNCIYGKKKAAIGNGNGHSVTALTQVYKIPKYGLNLMDSPGALDTKLTSYNEVLKEVEYVITKTSSKTCIDAILLVESLTDGTMQLTRNLNQLQLVFGKRVLKSIIVIGTKVGLSKTMYGDTRLKSVTEECQRFNLKFILFESYKNYQQRALMTGNELNNQMSDLVNLMDQIQLYQMDAINKTRQNIKKRAQQLMNAAPTQYTAHTVYYNETYSAPYTVNESYSTVESYQAQESYQISEPYTVQETYQVNEAYNVWDVVGKKTNVFKYGKRPKKQWGWVTRYRLANKTRNVTKDRNVTKYKTVTKQRPVTKSRNVTKYRTQQRQKSKQERVAITKNIDPYMIQAKNEWEKEVKAALQRNVSFL